LRADSITDPGFTIIQGDTNGDGVADFQLNLACQDASTPIVPDARFFVL
jgi:hypothetical protein